MWVSGVVLGELQSCEWALGLRLSRNGASRSVTLGVAWQPCQTDTRHGRWSTLALLGWAFEASLFARAPRRLQALKRGRLLCDPPQALAARSSAGARVLAAGSLGRAMAGRRRRLEKDGRGPSRVAARVSDGGALSRCSRQASDRGQSLQVEGRRQCRLDSTLNPFRMQRNGGQSGAAFGSTLTARCVTSQNLAFAHGRLA